ncbi:acyl-CoA synthetase [Enemella dayhoffiae]|uniref:Acyl-CoA synthetase n=1 Tax=Enemella dayhoffiae TaxID=2016507 RepID=A0A255GTU4_9ACTN|nr:AMP-binding protein [Enemella dayhoffiae]OYO16554.1 acyl-CoA synthetase [Enemella dayhoffiae]
MPATFAECIAARRDHTGGGLRFEGARWTWAEVVAEADRRRGLLRTMPRQPKEHDTGQLHLGLLLENTPEFVFWLFAAALEGAVVVGLNTTRRGAELAADITHADCDLVLVEQRTAPLLEGLSLPVPVHDAADLQLIDDRPITGFPAAVGPETLLLLLFSSGSTGRPKAVACSQGRLATLARTLSERVELHPGSVTYLCAPLFHGNALMLNLAPALWKGATVVLARRFSATAFTEAIAEHGITFVNYVGRILAYVLARPALPGDADSTLELAYGTEASAADVSRFGERYGCRVQEGYGLSEGVVRINRVPGTPADALGQPVCPYPVQVRNSDTGLECPPAERDEHGRVTNPDQAIGEIVAVGGAAAFEGYYRNPGASVERIRGDDFWTGDLAYRDEDGWFYFAGRANDWLRIDGENLAAGPIERILERHPAVAVAAVYSVPDPRTGDQLMCTLQADCFEPQEFADFLSAQGDLGAKSVPRFIRVTDRMPTTGSNKTSKSPLRRSAWRTRDRVWWRPGRELSFAPFGPAERAEWEREFDEHGRSGLLPESGK